MFKSSSIVYDINIICKILSIILMITSLTLLKSPVFLVFIGLFFLVTTLEFKKISILAMIGTFLSILATFYSPILFFSKLILLLIYMCLVKKITSAAEMRYILEITLYKFQSKKITFYILYIIYFFKQLKKNVKILDRLRDEYGMVRDLFYIRYSLRKAWKKTKYEMRELIQMNNLRFYNFSKQRTYVEKPKWESWDTKYLLIHLVFTVLICIYGR